MAMVVKNNMEAVGTLNNLNKNSEALAKSLAKVSSGMKIRGAGDDASGFAISEKMRVQIKGLQQDIQNGQTATSILKVAEGAVSSTVEILKTLKEKAINAANDTNTDVDRQTIQKEVEQSIDQIDDNALVTYNGKYMLDGRSTIDVPTMAVDVVMRFISALDATKKFMGSLDNTTQAGWAALDEAVNEASGGKFTDMQSLIDSFLTDLANNSGSTDAEKKRFLQEYCSINLDNSDTGAITGYDAGGDTVMTKESIVPEYSSGPISGWDYPDTASTTINGLTINWPTAYTELSGGGRTATVEAQKNIVRALNTEWMKNCLALVTDSYGLSFDEDSGATVNTIDLKFDLDENSNWLAWATNWPDYSGNAYRLAVTINMYYYSSLADENVNGYDTISRTTYVDAILAHELTHSIMAANIKNFNSLPTYIKEGAAELVIGIDNIRKSSILALSDPSNIENYRSLLEGNVDDIDSIAHSSNYAGGYMLLRYLAKQSSSWVGSDEFRYERHENPWVFQLGTRANQNIRIGFGDMRAKALGLEDENRERLSVITREKAVAALDILDSALAKALDEQTTLGAIQIRMEHTINNLTVACENVQRSESTIRDADMAKEMTEYTKNNVLAQTAQSILARANQNSSSVVSLLQ